MRSNLLIRFLLPLLLFLQALRFGVGSRRLVSAQELHTSPETLADHEVTQGSLNHLVIIELGFRNYHGLGGLFDFFVVDERVLLVVNVLVLLVVLVFLNSSCLASDVMLVCQLAVLQVPLVDVFDNVLLRVFHVGLEVLRFKEAGLGEVDSNPICHSYK